MDALRKAFVSKGLKLGNDKALGFKKALDVDAVRAGVFESYFCICDRLTVKGIKDSSRVC